MKNNEMEDCSKGCIETKHMTNDAKSCSNSVMNCYAPSSGMTLILSLLLFGLDRFYVGQIGIGVAFLIGTLSGIGLVVVVPVQLIAAISLIMTILGNKRTSFMYGCNVIFDPPSIVDKIIAITILTILLVGIAIGILGSILF